MSELPEKSLDNTEENRRRVFRVRVQIPKKYQDEPLISRLATQHNLDVNISAATLGLDSHASGWFDLQLRGKSQDIINAVHYLLEQDIEVLQWNENEVDGW